ncbi:MAG TPA: hypothetical protein VKB39_02030 [Candidatus Baltobacteraceae bacterium]|nr:hypothetical protein [Candidatus Baltobacteraceae bacterium]
MKLQRLCFVAAIAATLSMTFSACNGGSGGIPMTPGMPESDSGPEMPDASESMGPETAESAEPAPSGTPVVVAPYGPMMPQTSTSPEPSTTPAPSATPETLGTPVASAAPAVSAMNDFRPSPKIEARTVSVTMHLNQKKLPAGSYLWFDSTFALRNGESAAFQMQKSQITLAGHTYSGPTGVVNVTPNAKSANVTPSNDAIVSTFPSKTSGTMFMDGLVVYLPTGLPAHQTVTWTARFQDSKPSTKDLKIRWHPSASAYSQLPASYQSLQIKPVTGAPQNFAKHLIPGTAATASSRDVTICCRG